MSETPTYASLTPLTPTMPSVMNGLPGHDIPIQSSQSLNHHQSLNYVDHAMSQSPLLSNHGPGSLTVLSPAAPQPGTPSSVMSEMKTDTPEPQTFDKNSLVTVLQFLRKNNLKSSEELLRRECSFFDDIEEAKPSNGMENFNFESYKNDGDPTDYEDAYLHLTTFVERSLDSHKHEIAQILYPVFVHMYLELVYNEHENLAVSFLEKFSPQQEDYYQDDILSLSLVTTRDHMTGHQMMDNFRSNIFNIRISREPHNYFKKILTEQCAGTISRIVQERLSFDVFDGIPRTKEQITSTAGAFESESARQVNKTRIFYGLLKEPELQGIIMEEDEADDESDKPKRKKSRRDPLFRSKRNDPNAPSHARIPLPDLREADKLERAKTLRDAMKRAHLSKDSLPSICFYTFLNTFGTLSCIEFSDDSSMMAFGTSDSSIHIQSITPAKLKAIKSVDQLNEIDKESDDVLVRMMDERTAEWNKQLLGHSGAVYSCSFSPDRSLFLSCSKDGTIRLWSLQTWTCLVVYKGHIHPVWDVQFSPMGYYFVSGGHDRTARLWATDQTIALRIFAGHFSDVDVVRFHPNCNYVASGSSDKAVRVWDVSNGNCVRILTGHKGTVTALAFSPCGRYLVSGGRDHNVLVWDLSDGSLVAEFFGHTDVVYTLAFARDGAVLSSGGLDRCVKIWDFGRITEENQDDDGNFSNRISYLKNSYNQYFLGSFPTKATSVLGSHFTRRNVLLAAGPFES